MPEEERGRPADPPPEPRFSDADPAPRQSPGFPDPAPGERPSSRRVAGVPATREARLSAPRLPCPVCLGARMERSAVGDGRLVVDHCGRCGGAWFEEGEVLAVRALDPGALTDRIPPRDEPFRMRCRSCDARVSRDAEACPACSEPVRLDCPACGAAMATTVHQRIRLDYCASCRGVWFDGHELREIWTLNAERVAARGGGRSVTRGSRASAVAGTAQGVVEILFWAPGLGLHGAHAAGHALGAAAEGLAHAPELAAGAAGAVAGGVEAAGHVAESVFELIVEAIASIFG